MEKNEEDCKIRSRPWTDLKPLQEITSTSRKFFSVVINIFLPTIVAQ